MEQQNLSVEKKDNSKNLLAVRTSSRLSDAEATELYRHLLERDFFGFVTAAWPILEPATKFIPNWHIELICEYMMLVRKRKTDYRKLILNIPPRHSKSIIVSVMFPAWCWTTSPELRFICSSYSDTLSIKHSLDRRAVVTCDWYQRLWGDKVSLADDQNLKSEFQNSMRGVMTATSTGGSVTGKGCDFLLVDDPHDPSGALSDLERATALRHFDQTLSTRLDQPTRGCITIIMQRLHQGDLTGHLIEGQGWNQLVLPAIAEVEETRKFPISGRVHVRQPGELLWAERFPQDVLDLAKHRLGSYGFSGQYMQRPSPLEGGILRRSWWRRYTEIPERFDEMIQSWDLAFKETKTSDYVCGQVWGRIGANKYLLDQVRRRMSFTETISAMKALSAKWPLATAKLVEDKANGPAVINSLKNQLPGIIGVNPQGSKESRVSASSPEVEAGNYFIPKNSIGDEFIEECAGFPNFRFDDQVDAWSQVANRFRSSYAGVLEYYERMAGTADSNQDAEQPAEATQPLAMFSSIDRTPLKAPWERETVN
jgi:predicted phage terminase large subunit-like protein